ncbi:MAG: hypothetical protein V4454_12685 [Pseudomonadota bacterium]
MLNHGTALKCVEVRYAMGICGANNVSARLSASWDALADFTISFRAWKVDERIHLSPLEAFLPWASDLPKTQTRDSIFPDV